MYKSTNPLEPSISPLAARALLLDNIININYRHINLIFRLEKEKPIRITEAKERGIPQVAWFYVGIDLIIAIGSFKSMTSFMVRKFII